MACEFVCDGCGCRASGDSAHGQWYKPIGWFERADEDGIQTACSRACIQRIADKTGKTSTVLPV